MTAEIGGSLPIDATTNKVLHTIPLGGGTKPVGIAVGPQGAPVYVADGAGARVIAVDPRARTITASIPVGRRPWGIALTPDGRKLYTANGVSNDISVIDTSQGKVVATIRVGEGPWGVAIGPAPPQSPGSSPPEGAIGDRRHTREARIPYRCQLRIPP